MNTSPLPGACVALFMATASLRADINPDDLSGRYRGQGENYVTDVTVRKIGDQYEVQWQRPNADYRGVGIREGNLFSASFGAGDQTGVAVYRIERDRLVGKYTAPNMNGLSTETLTPLGAPAAEAIAAPGGAIPVGTRVAARWARTEFYLATIKSRDGGKIHVLYDDNDEADVTDADLLPVAKPNEIVSGRRVLACWQSAKMYTGTVLEAKGAQNVIVKWDDGSEPSPVPKDYIALLPEGFK